ncbi:hypothetical protein OROMI_003856 [Orobanche minor]
MADDRSGEEQSSGPPPPPVIPEEDRIYLSSQPDGVWWEDKRVVELLGRSFTDTYHEYVTCWSDASARQRDAMYQYIAAHVRVDTGYNLRAAYESRIKPRITVTINRVAKKGKKPIWMPTQHFTRLMKRPEDPTWNAKAGKAKAKANRLKGGQDGKGPATSTLGQQSAARAFSSLGTDSRTPHGLLCKSKKNKKGEWITPRAEQIDAEYQRLRQLHDPDGQMTEDAFQTYLQAAGGFDKKTSVFGLGSVAKELFVPPTTSSRSSMSSQSSYTPSLISQYAAKNQELEMRLSQLQTEYAADKERAQEDRRRHKAMDAKLAEQFGWTFDEPDTRDDL